MVQCLAMEPRIGRYPNIPTFTGTDLGRVLREQKNSPARLGRQVGILLAAPEQHDLRNYVNHQVSASQDVPAAVAAAAVIRLFQDNTPSFPVVTPEHLPASDEPIVLDQFVEDSNPNLAEIFRQIRTRGINPVADFCFTTTARNVYVALARACQRKPNL